MFIFRTQFSFQIFNIVYSGKDNRLKSSKSVAIHIIPSQLREKIKKYLIISGTIYFINQ